MYFLIIKINNFRGDVSDISAKKATLMQTFYYKLDQLTVSVAVESDVSFGHHENYWLASSSGNKIFWMVENHYPRSSAPRRNLQCCRVSRNIASVAPKSIYFYYQKIYLQDQSIQK